MNDFDGDNYSNKKLNPSTHSILVYPGNTEIALEVIRSLSNNKSYKLTVSTTSIQDKSSTLFYNSLTLPFVSENSDLIDVEIFSNMVNDNDFDLVYLCNDGVISKLSKFRYLFRATLMIPDDVTISICRSKSATYTFFKDFIQVPTIYTSPLEISNYPIFIKPDVGQGSKGAELIHSSDELKFKLSLSDNRILVMEYLSGDEFTIDCLTNKDGILVYSLIRERISIKNGISVHSRNLDDENLFKIASIINSKLSFKGAWFFQVRYSKTGLPTLLEIGSRLSGSSALSRGLSVNLPRLHVEIFLEKDINTVSSLKSKIVTKRNLTTNYYGLKQYQSLYIDFDDTILVDDSLNINAVVLIHKFITNNKKVYLITRHRGNLIAILKLHRIDSLFDEIIHLRNFEKKSDFIKDDLSLFVDDSYNERTDVSQNTSADSYDVSEIEVLINSDIFWRKND
jgi:hypothetical protein